MLPLIISTTIYWPPFVCASLSYTADRLIKRRLCLTLSFLCPGVDLEAAKRLEEEEIMMDARAWLNDGPPADVRHPRTGATPLHVAAAKGYLEVLK